MPPSSVLLPKVRRTSADTSATPIVASNMPKHAPTTPFKKSSAESADTSDNPSAASQKYSAGPKASAALASGGDKNKSANAPTKPPNTDEKQLKVTAKSPRPFFAMG